MRVVFWLAGASLLLALAVPPAWAEPVIPAQTEQLIRSWTRNAYRLASLRYYAQARVQAVQVDLRTAEEVKWAMDHMFAARACLADTFNDLVYQQALTSKIDASLAQTDPKQARWSAVQMADRRNVRTVGRSPWEICPLPRPPAKNVLATFKPWGASAGEPAAPAPRAAAAAAPAATSQATQVAAASTSPAVVATPVSAPVPAATSTSVPTTAAVTPASLPPTKTAIPVAVSPAAAATPAPASPTKASEIAAATPRAHPSPRVLGINEYVASLGLSGIEHQAALFYGQTQSALVESRISGTLDARESWYANRNAEACLTVGFADRDHAHAVADNIVQWISTRPGMRGELRKARATLKQVEIDPATMRPISCPLPELVAASAPH